MAVLIKAVDARHHISPVEVIAMYYACIVDRWTDELFTADPCDTMEEAQQLIADELAGMIKATEKAVILTAAEYRKEKERSNG